MADGTEERHKRLQQCRRDLQSILMQRLKPVCDDAQTRSAIIDQAFAVVEDDDDILFRIQSYTSHETYLSCLHELRSTINHLLGLFREAGHPASAPERDPTKWPTYDARPAERREKFAVDGTTSDNAEQVFQMLVDQAMDGARELPYTLQKFLSNLNRRACGFTHINEYLREGKPSYQGDPKYRRKRVIELLIEDWNERGLTPTVYWSNSRGGCDGKFMRFLACLFSGTGHENWCEGLGDAIRSELSKAPPKSKQGAGGKSPK